ncbi:hypothetical protein T4B_11416 [Trichinella pseudospiralis]|uniref:Uncharacterized protein n=1 Tax=Trichinella pseudospiralis TaxID=6337 RepID=A0A0V1HR06_TRIPS|nr:hypothetical protein T4B_11416 [Trichinella pseudospiralis]
MLGLKCANQQPSEVWPIRMNKRLRKHHLGFYQLLQLIIDEQDYGVQQRRVAALTGRLRRSEFSIEHFLSAISYHNPAPLKL